MRKCPFNDCEEVIGDHLFACRRHWYSLNLTERQEVYAAYNDYTSATIGGEEHSYCEVVECEAVIEAVADQPNVVVPR